MTALSPLQRKILKKIKRVPKFDYTEASSATIDVIHFLAKCGYVVYQNEELPERILKFCKITSSGYAALNEHRTSLLKWWIPVVISIFAAIGGYRQELSWLLRELLQLLKAITAN